LPITPLLPPAPCEVPDFEIEIEIEVDDFWLPGLLDTPYLPAVLCELLEFEYEDELDDDCP
jgi:hypothetical protein